MVRLIASLNILERPGAPLSPQVIVDRAKRGERLGFDILTCSDYGIGDVFAPLVLAAVSTDQVGLMSYVATTPTRSPVLLASGAAWVDQVSGGRFIFGLGPSYSDWVTKRHGLPYERPAQRMTDTLRIVRSLFGEDIDGVSRLNNGSISYRGRSLQVSEGRVDLQPIHLPDRYRPPLIVAANGARMLKIAGALADGVIVQMTTPAWLGWAWGHIRSGAEQVGRSLDGFEMSTTPTFIVSPTTVDNKARYHERLEHFMHRCLYPEFDGYWDAAGLGQPASNVRDALRRDDAPTAERIIRDEIWPEIVLFSTPADAADRFWVWLDSRLDAGVTMLNLPMDLETLIGVSLQDVRRHISGRRNVAR